jgi:ribosomal protein S27AE
MDPAEVTTRCSECGEDLDGAQHEDSSVCSTCHYLLSVDVLARDSDAEDE